MPDWYKFADPAHLPLACPEPDLPPEAVFSTFLWHHKPPVYFGDHIRRILGQPGLSDRDPWIELLRRTMASWLAHNKAVLKVKMICAHSGSPPIHCQLCEAEAPPDSIELQMFRGGIPAYTQKWWDRSRWDRQPPRHTAGIRHERLLVDEQGHLLETDTANVLLCIRGVWFTPDWLAPATSNHFLPGVTIRNLVQQKQVTRRILRIEDLAQAAATEICNAVLGRRSAVIQTS